MKILETGFVLGVIAAALGGCSKQESGATMSNAKNDRQLAPVVQRAEDVKPLEVGDQVPDAVLVLPEGATEKFSAVYRSHPTVLIFYRGGWCPYCNRHLAEVGSVESQLRGMGYQIVAVSPDSPLSLRESLSKEALGYRLYSDSDMVLARGFGLAFHVDDATVELYKGYGIDLDKATGRPHHDLPVPAVFIVDQGGTIRYAHTNPDYKARLSAQEILSAAESAKGAR